jgi:hypothetical protein
MLSLFLFCCCVAAVKYKMFPFSLNRLQKYEDFDTRTSILPNFVALYLLFVLSFSFRGHKKARSFRVFFTDQETSPWGHYTKFASPFVRLSEKQSPMSFPDFG